MENQQQQQSTTLCRTGCGFFGSPANEGLCSKCYKDQVKQEQDAARLTPTVTVPVASSSTTAADLVHPTETPQTCAQAALASSEVTAKLESDDAIASQAVPSPAIETPSVDVPLASKKANRCLMCKKRVGLTGFTCRCGGLYCGEHRYDKAHNCSFDYKTMEREEIRKNNPVVVSDKIARL